MNDLQLAVRTLRKSPAFTLASVATLALAVGAATAVFSVARTVLFAPLPYAEPERIVRLIGTSGSAGRYDAISYPDYRDVVAHSGAFTKAAAFDEWSPALIGSGEPEVLTGGAVDSGFFDVLGIRPARGRFFVAREDTPGQDVTAVISDSLWRRKFGAREDVIGRPIQIDGRTLTIVGITPPGFHHPYLTDDLRTIDIWTTLAIDPATNTAPRNGRSYTAIARLAPGVTREQATARVAAVSRSLETLHPENDGCGVTIVPLRERITASVRQPIRLLLGAVVLLLVIACVNVANLNLARITSRAGDSAVRAALGATPWHLARQLMAETLLLGLAGALGGLAIAFVLVRRLFAFAQATIPRAAEVTIDLRVAAFAVAAGLAAAVVIGAIPAIRLWLGVKKLTPGTRGTTEDVGSSRVHAALVVVQVALSVVLLMAAAVVGRSLWNLLAVDTGLADRSTIVFDFRVPRTRYRTPEDIRRFYFDVEQKMRALPGVLDAGATTLLPLNGDFNCNGYSPGPAPTDPRSTLCAEERTVTPGYLHAVGIAIIAGRGITAQDLESSPRVVVIDETLARKHWQSGSAVGQMMRVREELHQIVGIAGAARIMTLQESPQPTMYLSYAQASTRRSASMVIQTRSNLDTLAPAIRRAVAEVSPDAPVQGLRTLRSLAEESVGAPRLRAILLTVFGVAALLLAAIGVAGVLALMVTRRRREIGVRLALGATAKEIVALVLGRGMRLVLLGIALGELAALASGRVLGAFLFGVPEHDPISMATVALVLALAGWAASMIPALRAGATDAFTALNSE